MLRPDDAAHVRLDDAGLLGRDFGQGITQKLLMIHRHRRDRRQCRTRDHIGRIQPAAQAVFQQKHIGGRARKCNEGSRRSDFKKGDFLAGVGVFAFI